MSRILVTGANKGIGYALVEAILSSSNDTVALLGSRDAARGEAAVSALLADHPAWSNRLHLVIIDVADDASVAAAADAVRALFPGEAAPLYGLVNNAGIGFGELDHPGILNVNTRGIQRVTKAFLPLIADGGRVVNMTSGAAPMFVQQCSARQQAFFTDASHSWEALDAFLDHCLTLAQTGGFEAEGLGSGDPYGLSKAAANTLTMIQARENPAITVNACTPGFIETDLTRPFAEGSGRSPEAMGMLPPEAGTRAPMKLLFTDVGGAGWYFGSDGLRSPMHAYRSPGSPAYTGE